MTRKVTTLQPVGIFGDVQSPMSVDLDGFALPAAKYKAVNLAGPQTFAAGDITGRSSASSSTATRPLARSPRARPRR
jgi:hypothetical protein